MHQPYRKQLPLRAVIIFDNVFIFFANALPLCWHGLQSSVLV